MSVVRIKDPVCINLTSNIEDLNNFNVIDINTFIYIENSEINCILSRKNLDYLNGDFVLKNMRRYVKFGFLHWLYPLDSEFGYIVTENLKQEHDVFLLKIYNYGGIFENILYLYNNNNIYISFQNNRKYINVICDLIIFKKIKKYIDNLSSEEKCYIMEDENPNYPIIKNTNNNETFLIYSTFETSFLINLNQHIQG